MVRMERIRCRCARPPKMLRMRLRQKEVVALGRHAFTWGCASARGLVGTKGPTVCLGGRCNSTEWARNWFHNLDNALRVTTGKGGLAFFDPVGYKWAPWLDWRNNPFSAVGMDFGSEGLVWNIVSMCQSLVIR